ncbi:MAG: cytochrome c oxidase subunit II [Bdellovibrionota bacterium]
MGGKGFLDWMPDEGSSWAERVDLLNNFITYTAAFCTVAITALMLYFAFKYRKRSSSDQTLYLTHNSTIETIWTVIPTLVCIVVGYCGFAIYHEMRNPPANSIEINVTARQWSWSYTYPNGKTADKDLVVPVNQPVKFIMKSQDVNHSFFVPVMRVKEDVMANEYHYLWFTPTKLGKFHIFCAEYCGNAHSAMTGTLNVVSAAEYEDFLNDRKVEELSPVDLGKKIYTAKACNACHSLDGSKLVGPSFKGLFGTQVELEDLPPEPADENYLRESIVYSQKKIVKGYPRGAMPSFEGQIKDNELDGLIAFIKSVK